MNHRKLEEVRACSLLLELELVTMSSSGAFRVSEICGGNFPKRKKSAAELFQMLGMITIEIVIKSTHLLHARDYILPVCIVRHGTILLVSSYNY